MQLANRLKTKMSWALAWERLKTLRGIRKEDIRGVPEMFFSEPGSHSEALVMGNIPKSKLSEFFHNTENSLYQLRQSKESVRLDSDPVPVSAVNSSSSAGDGAAKTIQSSTGTWGEPHFIPNKHIRLRALNSNPDDVHG